MEKRISTRWQVLKIYPISSGQSNKRGMKQWDGHLSSIASIVMRTLMGMSGCIEHKIGSEQRDRWAGALFVFSYDSFETSVWWGTERSSASIDDRCMFSENQLLTKRCETLSRLLLTIEIPTTETKCYERRIVSVATNGWLLVGCCSSAGSNQIAPWTVLRRLKERANTSIGLSVIIFLACSSL